MNNGNKNRSIGKVLTTSSADIYVVPAAFKADVESIVVTNTSNSVLKFDLSWYQATTATTYTIANDVELKPNSLLQLTDSMYLDKNDKIVGAASITDLVTVTVRVREYFAERL
jgi:hypothetical protein